MKTELNKKVDFGLKIQFWNKQLDFSKDLIFEIKLTKNEAMYEIGKSSWEDREVGKFYARKFFPSSDLYG